MALHKASVMLTFCCLFNLVVTIEMVDADAIAKERKFWRESEEIDPIQQREFSYYGDAKSEPLDVSSSDEKHKFDFDKVMTIPRPHQGQSLSRGKRAPKNEDIIPVISISFAEGFMTYDNMTVPLCLPALAQSTGHESLAEATCRLPSALGQACNHQCMCTSNCKVSGSCCLDHDLYCESAGDAAYMYDTHFLSAPEFTYRYSSDDQRLNKLSLLQTCVPQNSTHSYYLVTRYLNEYGEVQDCPTSDDVSEIKMFGVPIIHYTTGLIFINQRCLALNAIMRDAVEYMTLDLVCEYVADGTRITPDYVMQNCQRQFVYNEALQRCHSEQLNECPTWPLSWDTRAMAGSTGIHFKSTGYGNFTIDAVVGDRTRDLWVLCAALYSPVYDSERGVFAKNAFCALCNRDDPAQLDPASMQCANNAQYPPLSVQPGETPPSTFRYRLHPASHPIAVSLRGKFLCPEGHIYSLQNDNCFRPNCSLDVTSPGKNMSCVEGMTRNAQQLRLNSQVLKQVVVATAPGHTYQQTVTVGINTTSLDDDRLQALIEQVTQTLTSGGVKVDVDFFEPCDSLSLDERVLAGREGLGCLGLVLKFDYQYIDNLFNILFLPMGAGQPWVQDYLLGYRVEFAVMTGSLEDFDEQCAQARDDVTEGSDEGQGESSMVTYSDVVIAGTAVMRANYEDMIWYSELMAYIPHASLVLPFSLIKIRLTQMRVGSRGSETIEHVIKASVCKNHLLLCDISIFQPGEYEFLADLGELKLLSDVYGLESGLEYGRDFAIDGNYQLLICRGRVREMPVKEWTLFQKVQQIVTCVGGGLSLISYLATVVMCVVWRGMRGTHAQCRVCLFLCLAVGHACLLLSIIFRTNEPLCKVASFVQHYSWLAALLWMNCLIFDLFYMFRNPAFKLPRNRTLVYCAYSFTISALVTAGYVLIFSFVPDLFDDSGAPTGNDGPLCWLVSDATIIYFYILPVALVLLASLALLVLTFVRLYRCCGGGGRSGDDTAASAAVTSGAEGRALLRRAGRAFLVLFIVSLTGLLAYVFGSDLWSMIFTVLCSFQGVLLLGAFGFKKEQKRLTEENGTEGKRRVEEEEEEERGEGKREEAKREKCEFDDIKMAPDGNWM